MSKQVALLDRMPRAVMAGAGAFIVHTQGHEPKGADVSSFSYDDLLLDRHNEIPSSSLMMRRDALLGEMGLIDEDLPGSYAEDYDLMLRAAAIHPVVAVREPLTNIHWNGGSFFADRWTMIADALTYMVERHPGFRQTPEGYARILGQVAFAQAAAGEGKKARSSAVAALRRNPTERRSYLAIAMSARLVSAQRVMDLANARGRGI